MIIETEHGGVFVHTEGPARGLPLVFTHGLTMDHRTFAAQVDALSDTCRVITWDLPAHGESFRLEPEEFRFKLLADVLLAVLDNLEVERAVLVGQSVASLFHQYVAWHHPDRVAALVDVGGLPLHEEMSGPMLVAGKVGVSMSALLPESAFYSWFANARSIKEETRAYMVEGISRFGKRPVIKMTHAYFEDQAEGIPAPPEVPLLIINGEEEMGIVKKGAVKWAEAVGARRVVIPDAGHIANQDNPEAFSAALRPFLEEVADSTRQDPLGTASAPPPE